VRVGDSTQRLFVVFRTDHGKLGAAYTDDGGQSFEPSIWLAYSPTAQPPHHLKNPLGTCKAYQFANGNYLMLFYNNAHTTHSDRWTYWLTGGRAVPGADGKMYIEWSQPEVAYYNPNHEENGPAYPDFVEMSDGRIHLIEAQKVNPRFHTLNASLPTMLWSQHTMRAVPKVGLVLDAPCSGVQTLPWREPGLGASFALAAWVAFPSAGHEVVAVDSTGGGDGQGLRLSLNATAVELRLTDGSGRSRRDGRACSSAASCAPVVTSDDVCAAAVGDGKLHHIAAIVDGASGIASLVVDGTLCDGGSVSVQGWSYLDPALGSVPAKGLRVGEGVRRVRLYDRYLRTSEAIGAWRAGL